MPLFRLLRCSRPCLKVLTTLPERSLMISSKLFDVDYYTTLGVSKGADTQTIKTAYFRLAKKFHPDYNNSPNAAPMFEMISEAYEVLSNPDKRQKFDEFGTVGETVGGMTHGPGRKRGDETFSSEDLYKRIFKECGGNYEKDSKTILLLIQLCRLLNV